MKTEALVDSQVRKQLLQTRIALDRAGLRHEALRVRQAVGAPLLWRALVGADLARSLSSGGAGGATLGAAHWLRVGMTLLRRYRVAATVLGGVLPLLRVRRGIGRIARLGAVGAAAWFGWRAWRRGRGADGDRP